MCSSRRRSSHESRETRDVQFVNDPEMRAADADRERVVADLREHAGAGRLDVEELEERVTAAYAARTHGDLAALLRDLPSLAHERRRESRGERARAEAFEHARVWMRISLLLIAIWAFTGFGYFWPIWPVGCWGVFVLFHLLEATRRPRRAAGSPLRA